MIFLCFLGFLEHVTVLIGISVRDQAVGGVMHQPFWGGSSEENAGRTIWGLQGFGVEGLPFAPKFNDPLPLIVTTSRSHSNPLAESCLDAIKPEKVLRVGGAGYKVSFILLILHYVCVNASSIVEEKNLVLCIKFDNISV